MDKDPANPDWLSADNDEKLSSSTQWVLYTIFDAEIAFVVSHNVCSPLACSIPPKNTRILDEVLEPLFGTGNISLIDDTTNNTHPTTSNAEPPTATRKSVNEFIEKGTKQNAAIKKEPKLEGYGTIQDIEADNLNNTITNTSDDTTTRLKKKRLIDPDSVKPDRPTYNACLYMFHLLEGIAITAAMALLVTQIMPFILVQVDATKKAQQGTNNMTMNVLTIALRIYVSLFCCLFIMTELGTSFVHRTLPLLQHYSSRGFLYSFLGLICAEEAYSERIKETLSLSSNGATNLQHIGWASIFMEVSSWFMLGIGIVYMLLGMCCCKRLRDHYKQKEIDAWKQYKIDLQTWNRQYG